MLIIGILVLIYTFVPIGYIFALSFNQPTARSATAQFEGFTWNNWTTICEPDGPVRVAAAEHRWSSLTATDPGHRARHADGLRPGPALLPRAGGVQPGDLPADGHPRGRHGLLAARDVRVRSASTALLGFVTLVIAHTLFCLSFVVVTVKARLAGMDTRLEQAAMDLYANEWQTFRLVTLPLAMPGIVAAAMLAFSLSFDDFIVSNFTAGQSVTFPLYVYGAKLKEFPPQLFVVGSIMFLVSFVFVIVGEVWRRRRAAVTR